MRPPDFGIPGVHHLGLVWFIAGDASGPAALTVNVPEDATKLDIPAHFEGPRNGSGRRLDPLWASVLQRGTNNEPHAFEDVARGRVSCQDGVIEALFNRNQLPNRSVRPAEYIENLGSASSRFRGQALAPGMIQCLCRIRQDLRNTEKYHGDRVRSIPGWNRIRCCAK